jgi:copper oxidase (laccase) domain-containing protein
MFEKKWHIDLKLANRQLLEHAGVADENILESDVCTYDSVDEYFSARRLGTESGRIYSGIIL